MLQLRPLEVGLFVIFSLTPGGPPDGQTPPASSAEGGQVVATPEWHTIRAAYEAHRHGAFSVENGLQTHNPGQGWSTAFDGTGFVTTPDGGGWSWGLELANYGWGSSLRPVALASAIGMHASEVHYKWDDTLTEWHRNDARGHEHGFTVHARPAAASGKLTLKLNVRGDLHPRIKSGGRDVSFVNIRNAPVLDYTGLTVIDADGHTLSASFDTINGGLQLTVDDSAARYPLTIDPVASQAYLKASATGAQDSFGKCVAASGNTVVVGAPGEDSNATGVNGDPNDNSANGAGAVYVFVRNASTWTLQAYLKASNTGGADDFGTAVAISGDTIVVGADGEDSNSPGVNGDQSNNVLTSAGAAYVFVRNAGVWTQQAYLKATNPGSNDAFGTAVAISGNTVVVGAGGEDSDAIGVNGDSLNNLSSNSGAAYVFVRTGGVWSQQAYLKASNTESGDSFGSHLAMAGDTIAVSAHLEDSAATGVNGDQANNSVLHSGAVYVFVRNGGNWSQQAYLKASNTSTNDFFGFSVAISGDTLVAGAHGEASGAKGVNGDQSSNTASDSGAAYVFTRSGSTWSQQAYLKSSNTEMTDQFGYSVAVSGDLVLVGANQEDSVATGVNGSQTNNSAANSGAAYLFQRTGSNWSQLAYLKATNTGANDQFGCAVALTGDIAVLGASFEASNATGVNGNQSDNSVSGAGAAYVYDLGVLQGVASYGTGTPGCAGTETLGVTQAPFINSPNFAITCSQAPPDSIGLGLITDSQDLAGSDPFNIGVLLHCDFAFATEVLTADFYSDSTGYSETVGASIPDSPALIGKTFYACALWAWPTSTCVLPGFNPYNLSTSRGLAITILAP